MQEIVLIAWGLVVAGQDFSKRKISNYLTLGVVIVGVLWLLLRGVSFNGQSVMSVILGLAVASLLTIPGYVTKTLGAGDVKLLWAIAALCGLELMLGSFIVASVSVGVIFLCSTGLNMFLQYYGREWRPFYWNGQKRYIPFGTALGFGMIIFVLKPDFLGIRGSLAWLWQ
ncbi:prepilin peptidase CpaA [Methylobacillus rhizosphaerae]|uniref:Prepilin peptidase CpaA n=1 Tax=Methylobacillus rhizosphaerae TaxID=551994 RepID=A0A238YK58_9PROT|nr:A24 family peptidase [Methylobacillus rhizosphaerae]SNR71430.1 prepilin peptidase CpaA [Methylobacillus rhizosphaerae]